MCHRFLLSSFKTRNKLVHKIQRAINAKKNFVEIVTFCGQYMIFYYIFLENGCADLEVDKYICTICRHYAGNMFSVLNGNTDMCTTSLLTECCLFLLVTHSRKPLKYVLLPHTGLFGWQLIKHILGIIVGTLVSCALMQNIFTQNYTLKTPEGLLPLPEKQDQCGKTGIRCVCSQNFAFNNIWKKKKNFLLLNLVIYLSFIARQCVLFLLTDWK